MLPKIGVSSECVITLWNNLDKDIRRSASDIVNFKRSLAIAIRC